jgi:hypothetical protein
MATQEWQDWWDTVPADLQQKITEFEQSNGVDLTWHQRYLLAPYLLATQLLAPEGNPTGSATTT